MSVAKQVQASSLNVELVVGAVKGAGRPRVPFFEGAAANSDVVESTISSDAASIVSDLLNLTPYQRQILEANALSITAHGYKRTQGSDGLISVSSVRTASTLMHSLGFSLRKAQGALDQACFMKVLETRNGSIAVATARLGDDIALRCVYIDISVDVNTSPV